MEWASPLNQSQVVRGKYASHMQELATWFQVVSAKAIVLSIAHSS